MLRFTSMHLDNYVPPSLIPFWGSSREAGLMEKLYRLRSDAGTRVIDQRIEAVAICGSWSVGVEHAESDHDIIIFTGLPATGPDAVSRAQYGTEKADAIDAITIADGARYSEAGHHTIIGHVTKFAQWAPKGHALNLRGKTPTLYFDGIRHIREPYIPEGVPKDGLEWRIRVYRDLVRNCLAVRGEPSPPGKTIDDMWRDPVTRAQVRVAVNRRWDEDRYASIYTTDPPEAGKVVQWRPSGD